MTDAMPKLTADDFDNLRHMLGVTAKTPRGYRNCYYAGRDSVLSMERLKAHGFVCGGFKSGLSSDIVYYATVEGARAIGLKELPR